jgi:hypothetical protein
LPQPSELNDIPAPEGFVFLADTADALAHLSPADETSLPICGARSGSFKEFTFLPHRFTTCSACLRIADEASSARP